MSTSQEIADFLKSEKCREVVESSPCMVSVDGATYPAARYRAAHKYRRNMTCVQRGQNLEGDVYYRDAIYVVGPLPDLKAEGKKCCFTIPGEDKEWYVACHAGHKQKNEQNPFGHFYILMPWSANGKIDDYEPTPYKRVPLTVSPT